MTMLLRQTAALFLDAYRELNARRLFWFVLAISALVVGVFAALGLDEERGITILHWSIGFEEVARYFTPAEMYKLLFVNFGIKFWLAWLAAILALVSTASIFPEMINTGAIDQLLAKPIGRLRLFLTKYLTGLLFVTLQVLVFSAAAFLLIGIRGGEWEPSLFLAVPVLVLFFSYLFAICVLLGLLTKSTIAALLLTLLVWFGIYLVHATEMQLLHFRYLGEEQAKIHQTEVDETTAQLESLQSELDNADDEDDRRSLQRRITNVESQRDTHLRQADSAESQTLNRFHTGFYAAKTALPKTSETIELLTRWLRESADLPEEQDANGEDDPFENMYGGPAQRRATERLEETIHSRSVWWVVGTSLAFEFVVLTLAAWIFVRRDY